MENYFNISYEFECSEVFRMIDATLKEGRAEYVCVADGNILNMVHSDIAYRSVISQSLFSICDSGLVPLYLRFLYGIGRSQYCGPSIFHDMVSSQKYKMAFLGTDESTLNDLKNEIIKWNPEVEGMKFLPLPFKQVSEFDYQGIGAELDSLGVDIVWVALGAPKQEVFMSLLKPCLSRGVMIGVGAAFNYYSGHVKRAPKWMIAAKLEWLFRIFCEPKKQTRRCFSILKNLPGILREEMRSGKGRNAVN